LEALRLDGTLRASEGSCQCLLTILSFSLETCGGSVLGNTIDTDLPDLTSRPVFDTSGWSALKGESLIIVAAVAFADESATVSAVGSSRETSAFATGATGKTSALT
jgi:hypothetical protein